MKLSLNWLKELIPFTGSVSDLAQRLTMAGVEVEGIQAQGQGFDQVVVAQILKSDQHPNADRLSVCEVEAGQGRRQIVCGAKNYKVGDKVPLALPGAKLPNGTEIRRSKLRGVESDGMLCSARELGLAEDAEGLIILPTDLVVGRPLAEALGLNDTIFDLEITPNRPDLLSHWGLAREIAALMGIPGPDPRRLLSESDEAALNGIPTSPTPVPVRVIDPIRCPRYSARIIRGVKVGPSPEWLRRRLASLGQRSISNVVDITNFILLEIGQPLHAFDLKLLEGPEIQVRLAQPGEKLIRLDDITSELKTDMLVIADARRPVALAGVIGGRETAVSPSTTDLLLESATFQPSSIRKTSKTLAVSTDSSYRFERGVDVELAGWASRRATQLILQVCGGKVGGALVDVQSVPRKALKIVCRPARVNSLLGVTLPSTTTGSILQRLGCRVERSAAPADAFDVEPPSHRPDLEREIDLIEEIARIHGLEHIPGAMRPAPVSTTRDSAGYLLARELRSRMTALGTDEAAHYTVTSGAGLGGIQALAGDHPLRLKNPLSSDMDALRSSLFRGLLGAAARNLSGGNTGVALFEIGQVFEAREGKAVERSSLGIILAGARSGGASWEKGVHGVKYDLFDLKGIVEGLLEAFGLDGTARRDLNAPEAPELETGMGFLMESQGRVVGRAGKIAAQPAQAVKLAADAFYAEIDVEWLRSCQRKPTRYQPWPVYPPIRRDIALTVASTEKHQQLADTIIRLAKKLGEPQGITLQKVELFDIFESEKLGSDRKSLAYAMTYRSPDKTLTDAEVNTVHEALKKNLKSEIACELRE